MVFINGFIWMLEDLELQGKEEEETQNVKEKK